MSPRLRDETAFLVVVLKHVMCPSYLGNDLRQTSTSHTTYIPVVPTCAHFVSKRDPLRVDGLIALSSSQLYTVRYQVSFKHHTESRLSTTSECKVLRTRFEFRSENLVQENAKATARLKLLDDNG